MNTTTTTCVFAGCDRDARRRVDRIRPCGHMEPERELPVCDEHLTVEELVAPNASTCRVCGERNRVHLVMAAAPVRRAGRAWFPLLRVLHIQNGLGYNDGMTTNQPSTKTTLALSTEAYTSEHFDSVVESFRPRFTEGFSFTITPNRLLGGGQHGVQVTTNDPELAGELIAALEAAVS